jgi:hypothetical protein
MIDAPTAYRLACCAVVTLALLDSCERTQDTEPSPPDAIWCVSLRGRESRGGEKVQNVFPEHPGQWFIFNAAISKQGVRS